MHNSPVYPYFSEVLYPAHVPACDGIWSRIVKEQNCTALEVLPSYAQDRQSNATNCSDSSRLVRNYLATHGMLSFPIWEITSYQSVALHASEDKVNKSRRLDLHSLNDLKMWRNEGSGEVTMS